MDQILGTSPNSRPGTLLNGNVHYTQPGIGYRTGIEPVLMAAAIHARPGQTVLEAGCGAGAGLLCLLHRLPTIHAIGIEIDPTLAALARDNAAANGHQADIRTADILATSLPRADHAMANPPWHDPAGTQSPNPARRLALHGNALSWIAPLAATLTPRGTLTMALPAAAAAAAMAALRQAGLARITLLPLWPRPNTPARLILLQARRGADTCTLAPGLTLHAAANAYTPETEAILRHAAPLPIPL